MIAFVSGRVAATNLTSVVIEVGGVGMLVHATPTTIAGVRRGEQATLTTSMVVREDSLTLYGFADDEERDMFELVQTANGIGPKVAQAMIAVLSPDDIRTAVASDDHKTLTSVPGIGAKGAQRIVLELKDRVGPAASVAATMPASGHSPWRDQVHEALIGLGWSAREADKAVVAVAPIADEQGDTVDVPALLRGALRTLSKA
ncbi:Holliday junction branch migration protein RuvA [Solicola gregarius]|uniref:Holliday junction branch migration complex subunit RuvA n=1 Tax=Solicola gregarius TaxID=2908642 RepID=A0AA46TH99_9ACTN|nr:Holliday junction branch migration protein RuvA [Solicola gregarius]UYM04802.1 Holliday junction branch migration protein RuvA [Solicola gregarius]